jgi:hypothetical protein
VALSTRKSNSIFLNVPYDESFAELFLAYIVGICSYGMTPRTTLEVPGGEQRLRRIARQRTINNAQLMSIGSEPAR